MDFDEINRLIELMNENDLLEIELVEDSKKIRLKKKFEGATTKMVAAPMQMAAAEGAPASAVAPSGPADPPSAAGLEVKSPMVGTFYRSSNPESPPYVEVGDRVGPESVICIVEAMKVFNEIKAEVAGTVMAIMVENGESVEYGQTMFVVRPD